ncbi:hypothetical protein SUS17_3607 [Sphingomonas sp. S17]|nr:hypothetical protein SUS17_3607 [Sphingomonas sp. S17]
MGPPPAPLRQGPDLCSCSRHLTRTDARRGRYRFDRPDGRRSHDTIYPADDHPLDRGKSDSHRQVSWLAGRSERMRPSRIVSSGGLSMETSIARSPLTVAGTAVVLHHIPVSSPKGHRRDWSDG